MFFPAYLEKHHSDWQKLENYLKSHIYVQLLNSYFLLQIQNLKKKSKFNCSGQVIKKYILVPRDRLQDSSNGILHIPLGTATVDGDLGRV